MRHVYILIGFLPWILFGLLAGHSLLSLDVAIVVSFLTAIILGYQDLKKGYFLTWGTVLFFTFSLVAIVFLKNIWVITHVGLLVNIMLATIACGSLLIGKPFTEQIAKEKVSKELINKPAFKMKNRLITGLWAIIFLINLILSILFSDKGHLWALLNMFITIIVGFGLTVMIIEKIKLK